MKQHKFIFTLTLTLTLFTVFSGCKKEETPLDDPVPQILSLSVSPNQIVEYQDSLVFLVEYRDGDGDLGENDPDAANLFIIDNRINVTQEFRISELTPQGADIPITGTLRVILRNTGITNTSFLQLANFTVYLRDRAGNESNRMTSQDVTITR